jgi:hypothetical protein
LLQAVDGRLSLVAVDPPRLLLQSTNPAVDERLSLVAVDPPLNDDYCCSRPTVLVASCRRTIVESWRSIIAGDPTAQSVQLPN